ncbi:hypothetical protein IQ268_09810 [Oculatella sp. LEGE 06141]|uniref:hypothetical protein n=1 Tax=Oculatella sp. LEGE 06141 TaxID=1828648 RepID=UPI001881B4DB|nr:hypothetical protein [Oculatella sp. LEGE 06141]MBE9178854.1 hypothetical protein [Oculatella sp. LEGE 06141]
MKTTIQPLLIAAALMIAGLAVPLLGTAAGAQTTLDPLEGLQGDRSSDPFSTRGSNQMNSMFDLIHQANFGGLRTGPEFTQEQQRQIGDAAADFRQRQRNEYLQQNRPQTVQPDFVRPVYTPNPN